MTANSILKDLLQLPLQPPTVLSRSFQLGMYKILPTQDQPGHATVRVLLVHGVFAKVQVLACEIELNDDAVTLSESFNLRHGLLVGVGSGSWAEKRDCDAD